MSLQTAQEKQVGGDEGIRIHYQIPTYLHHRLKAEAALRGSTLKDLLILTLGEAVTRFSDEAHEVS